MDEGRASAEKSFGYSELMKRKAGEMTRLANKDMVVKKRMVDNNLRAQAALGLDTEENVAINDDVERMSVKQLREQIKRYPEVRLSGSKPQLQSRLRKLMRGEAFPVDEEDEDDAPDDDDDYAEEKAKQLADLEKKREIINKQIKELKKDLKVLEPQNKWSSEGAAGFYSKFTEGLTLQNIGTISAGSTIVFCNGDIMTSCTLVTVHGNIAIVHLHEKKGVPFVKSDDPNAIVAISPNVSGVVIPDDTKKEMLKQLKKITITGLPSSNNTSDAGSLTPRPGGAEDVAVELQIVFPEELKKKITEIEDKKYSKSSLEYRKCKNMYFGLGMSGFPNQVPKGTSMLPVLEKMLVTFFKDNTDMPFTTILLNKYTVGESMGAHEDANQKGHPKQVIVIFGEYEGGVHHIAGKEIGNGVYVIDARHKHWVTQITTGTRYSVVAFYKGFNSSVNDETKKRLSEMGYRMPEEEASEDDGDLMT